jgi:signal transduction histidine kinase
MADLEKHFQKDVDNIAQISIVPTILDVICQTTGMGFSAVARVTEDRWITCSVKDDINFGLKPGDELQVRTTICNEIRESNTGVVINHVSESPQFSNHHTPAMYGFESYISIPIIRRDGTFFGTLCAIDPKPHILDTPAVRGMFYLFADLISFHLHSIEHVNATEKRLEKEVADRTQELKEYNKSLEKMNKDLQAFAYISSHDLQEPLRKIQTISGIIAQTESSRLSEKGKDYFERLKNAAERMQTLINDLLAYSRTSIGEDNLEEYDLQSILDEVIYDVAEELNQKKGKIKATQMCVAKIIPFQFRQLLYNLIINAIKFSSPDRPLLITIKSYIASGHVLKYDKLSPEVNYCHITISDNGIGFDGKYNERIFNLFERLNDRTQYKGTGIGLAIVQRIIENHHGFITAHGELDRGATFDIYIPSDI